MTPTNTAQAPPHAARQSHAIELRINGERHAVQVEPWVTLLDLLRDRLHLTGTKKGCDHGQCGACTVLVDGKRVLSCLQLAVMRDGCEVTTVEGLASGETLHPLQRAFIAHDAFQCGYCTPGQLCSAVGLINEGQARSLDDVRELMSGNLCRCGAYVQIAQAVAEVALGPGDHRSETRGGAGGARDGAGMNPFAYEVARSVDAALAGTADARFIAGGTNLLDLMKEDVLRPARLIDINALPLADIEALPDGGLRLGALARNAETAYHPLVRGRYPLLSAAILAGASAQIRNMASNGGNLLQRTRCHYFYDTGVPCNKRLPGSGCPARDGLARQLAILGGSEQCIATHPSDMCVALAALGAVVQVQSGAGRRDIPFADFHCLPGETPQRDSQLAPDELILSITLPPADAFAAHSAYLKLRERLSYAFALVSVAAALDIDEGGRIRAARIALGGVAPKPWRREEAEALLTGEVPDENAFGHAADALLAGARAYGTGPGSNAFKIPLARRAIVRALATAARGGVTNTGDNLA